MVGLQELYLERDISSLSKSEKRLLQIALNLIINPDIIIFSEPFIYLDKMGTFNIYKIISDLIKKYKKTILILSNDINILYKICNNIIIFKDDKILINDKIDNVFKNTEKLKDNEIQLPNIIMFSSIAKDYGINIRNSKIVKDLIKDVYRNAKTVKKDK
jgi:energy-coupling factor transporter ATP-binding protein EcfA2